MHPSQTRETAFNKDEENHGQREILESRDIRQVPDKGRVEVQSQNRDLLMRDVCSCLARRAELDFEHGWLRNGVGEGGTDVEVLAASSEDCQGGRSKTQGY